MKAQEPLFYTVPEAADVLRVSRQTVYRLIQQGKLRGVKVSLRRTVVPASAINRLAEDGLQEGGKDGGETV